MNSCDKGKRGERELAAFLRECGIEARRGQQFSGGEGSPDVVHDIPGVHLECKRAEQVLLYPWLDQAVRDAGENIPVVAHRCSCLAGGSKRVTTKGSWLAIMRLSDLIGLMQQIMRYRNPHDALPLGEHDETKLAPELW